MGPKYAQVRDLNFQAHWTHICSGNAMVYPYCLNIPIFVLTLVYSKPKLLILVWAMVHFLRQWFTQITHIFSGNSFLKLPTFSQAMVYPFIYIYPGNGLLKNYPHFLRQWFTNQIGTTSMRRVAAACCTWYYQQI